MNIESMLVEIPKVANPTAGYIDSELKKLNITPIRWAVVTVNDSFYILSVANLKN